MKKHKNKFGISFLILVLAVAYIWFFIYNKPHRNIEKAAADFELSADACYHTFKSGDPEIAQSYLGKIITLSGVPSFYEEGESLSVLVFVYDQGMFGDEGIRCNLLPHYNETAQQLDLSKPVTIKGYCSGYNETDVILEQCSILETEVYE